MKTISGRMDRAVRRVEEVVKIQNERKPLSVSEVFNRSRRYVIILVVVEKNCLELTLKCHHDISASSSHYYLGRAQQ